MQNENANAQICIDDYDCFVTCQVPREVCIYTQVSLNASSAYRAMAKVDEEESVWCDVKLTGNDIWLIGCIYIIIIIRIIIIIAIIIRIIRIIIIRIIII